MLISIIVTVLNAEKYITDCINSVLNQSYEKFELIVVNDGSTDNTTHMIQSFKDDRIKYVYHKNVGQTESSNFAIEIAIGDYFLFLDADDILEPNCLLNFLYENPTEQKNNMDLRISLSDQISNPDVLNILKYYNESLDQKDEIIKQCLITFCFKNWFLPNSSFLIPNSIYFRKIRYNSDLDLDNNYDYFTRIILAANKFIIVKDAKVKYGFNSNSMSRRYDSKTIISAVLARTHAARNVLEYYPKQGDGLARNLFLQLIFNPNVAVRKALFVYELMIQLNLINLRSIDFDSKKKRIIYKLLGAKLFIRFYKIFKFIK